MISLIPGVFLILFCSFQVAFWFAVKIYFIALPASNSLDSQSSLRSTFAWEGLPPCSWISPFPGLLPHPTPWLYTSSWAPQLWCRPRWALIWCRQHSSAALNEYGLPRRATRPRFWGRSELQITSLPENFFWPIELGFEIILGSWAASLSYARFLVLWRCLGKAFESVGFALSLFWMLLLACTRISDPFPAFSVFLLAENWFSSWSFRDHPAITHFATLIASAFVLLTIYPPEVISAPSSSHLSAAINSTCVGCCSLHRGV